MPDGYVLVLHRLVFVFSKASICCLCYSSLLGAMLYREQDIEIHNLYMQVGDNGLLLPFSL